MQRLQGNDGGQGPRALHGARRRVAQAAVEALLVVGGEAQPAEPAAAAVALRQLHQRAAAALAALRRRHHHRLQEEAGPVAHHPGEAGVAQQPLGPRGPGQQHQADGELRAGLLQRVEPRGLAPPPLLVHQVGAAGQEVGPLVDGDHAEPILLLLGLSMAMDTGSRLPRSLEPDIGVMGGAGTEVVAEVVGGLRKHWRAVFV